MTSISFSLLVFFIPLIISAASEEPKKDSDVVILKGDNFDSYIESHDIVLVEFYAPWCGHCQQLEPHYEKAATTMKQHDPPVPLAKVDASAETELGSKYSVHGYPTLKLFWKGEVFDFEGGRTAEDIIEWVSTRAKPDWKPPPPAVQTLTSENFNQFVDENAYSIVEFYAPWCGHCKRFAPVYERVAKVLLKRTPSIPLAKVDGVAEPELAKKYGVTSYPSLKIFRKGRVSEFRGPRDEYEFQAYIEKNHLNAALKLSSLSELKRHVKPEKAFILGLFDNEEGPLFTIFQDTCNELRDEFSSGYSSEAEIIKEYGGATNTVILIMPTRFSSKYEPAYQTFSKGDATLEEVTKFVKSQVIPLVGHYEMDSRSYYDGLERPLCIFFYTVDFTFDHRDATQMWRNKIVDIAKDYKQIAFAIADDEMMQDVVKQFKLEDSGEDMNVGCYDSEKLKYAMPTMEEFTPSHIRKFLDDLLAERLSPILKSEPAPHTQSGHIRKLVGSTFNAEVLEAVEKDVLVLFCDSHDRGCKTMQHRYVQLATELADQSNLVIAKIDIAENDYPKRIFKFKDVPAIFLVPAHEKDKPIRFQGKVNDVPDLKDFLKQNCKAPSKASEKKVEL